jgi:hypothetical protein
MSQSLLSILIPSTLDRQDDLKRLLNVIRMQCGGTTNEVCIDRGAYKLHCIEPYQKDKFPVRVIVGIDNKEMTLGEKRELLYKESDSLYSWQIDSDDSISEDAISLILDAIKLGTDCITFQENCLINGVYYSSDHQLNYEDWGEKQNGFDYVRTPFYKDVIKTEIAKSVPFEYIRYGEDHAWSRALKPHLKNSYHIAKELYYYIHNSKPEDYTTRYGYDRD